MSKLKLFIDNILVYGAGSVISKLIPLLMVPVVASIMPNTGYFGLSDLASTVTSFATAFAVMGMYDAMYRMFFEKDDEEYKKKVCSTAFYFTIATSVVVFIIMLITKDLIAEFFFKDRDYFYLVYLCATATLIGGTNSIIAAPTRMQNKRKIYLITHTLSPILSYSISIPLLLNGYYVIALPLASIISSLTLELSFAVLNRKWFSIKLFDKQLLRQLIVIGIPLMPNFLIYWIFNSSDKLMITNIIDLDAAGVYSAGSKLGHTSQLIYMAFAGGWQYFAFSTMKEKDQVRSNSLIFEYLGVISFSATLFICALSYPIYDTFMPAEYLPGYIIAPYLFLAPLLQMLFQVICNQFLIIKKTWPILLILFSGAVINVVLNLALIPVAGIEGASIATLTGYLISVVICAVTLLKIKLLTINSRFIVCILITAAVLAMWRLLFPDRLLFGLAAAIGATAVYLFLYRKELSYLKKSITSRGKKENTENADADPQE